MLLSVASLPPTRLHRRLVYVSAITLIVVSAAAAPIADVPLPPLVAFVPTIEALIFVNDLITAILLFAQYTVVPSRAILVLACGYLYTALIIVPHVLTYPGAFAPDGLLGAGMQSTGWLYAFWHFGPPLAILGYACLKDSKGSFATARGSSPFVICGAVAGIVALVWGITFFVTRLEEALPSVFSDNVHVYRHRVIIIYSAVVLVTLIALGVLWFRRRSVLDYWLLLVIVASIGEDTLTAALVSARYSFGWYLGRGLLLATSLFILTLLLVEIIKLYTSLAASAELLRRERDNKLMSLEAMMSAIIHEIRQPLTAISANAGAAIALIARNPPDLQEARASLGDVVDDSHRTSEVLNSLRAMFRSADKDRQPIDFNELIIEVLKLMSVEFEQRRVQAWPELASSIPVIYGNKGQLQQVVFNLIHNALEAMGIAPAPNRVLRLTTERHGRDAIIVGFHDNGPGIDPTQIDGIFDAFVTTKPNGMGLGLAICRTIVESHGGKLSAASDGKSGAAFQFILPGRSTEAPVQGSVS